MYHQYFGLSEPAFSIAVNPRYLYMSRQHKEALAHLLYGVKGGGFVLLTGEVGTGKTTIIRSLLEQLPEDTELAMVLNPMANVPEMLGMICDELGAAYDTANPTVKNLTDALHHFLLDNHRRGHNTVLLIDEAQLLSPEALEQIRLLTNLETNTQKLLQIVLVGQPELNALLSQPRLRQLAQRITARFHLLPLSLAETRAYIAHRLKVAGMGGERNPFPPAIVKKIHRFSGGIPRRINILCERALIGLYGHNKHQVDGRIFNLAKKEVVGNLDDPSGSGSMPRWGWVAALVLLLVAAGTGLYWFIGSTDGDALRADAVQENRPAAVAGQVSSSASSPDLSATAASPEPSYRIRRLQDAQHRLFTYLELATDAGRHPCWNTDGQPLQCETIQLDSWDALAELNRPALLTLTTPEKFTAYGLLVGIDSVNAELLDEAGNSRIVPLSELGPEWSGRVFYTWQRPPGYSGPLGVNDQGPAVRWLAEQFALIDHQPRPLTTGAYNRALAERVKIFQQRVGLAADGIAGQQTVLKLNEILGFDKTLRRTGLIESSAADSAPAGKGP